MRITGLVERISAADSDEYFYSRPEGSQVGAIASPQSRVIESREWLDDHYKELKKQLKKGNIQRPEHWGGYIVKPVIIEFCRDVLADYTTGCNTALKKMVNGK